MLSIQKFINKFGNLEFANDFLREKFGIKITRELVFSSRTDSTPLTTFYLYNSARSVPNSKTIVNDAHNLILDDKTELVSIGVPHIPELKEECSDVLNWEEAWAEEKIEGIPITAYEYRGSWYLQTPDSPKARNVIPNKNLTYHTAVCHLLEKHFNDDSVDTVLSRFNKNYFYHMIYSSENYSDPSMEFLTLVSATEKHTLETVSDSKLTILAAEVDLSL